MNGSRDSDMPKHRKVIQFPDSSMKDWQALARYMLEGTEEERAEKQRKFDEIVTEEINKEIVRSVKVTKE